MNIERWLLPVIAFYLGVSGHFLWFVLALTIWWKVECRPDNSVRVGKQNL